jgi:anti-anti-sigma regulatory factor
MLMLRIIPKFPSPGEVVLEVAGWLTGEEVDLLDEEIALRHGEAKRLIVDLNGAKFIDENGLAMLKRWSNRQVVLQGGSSFVRMLLRTHGLD